METLGCIYAWAMWEDLEHQPEVPNIQLYFVPSLLVLALISTHLINLHPAIATTLLTQATSGQDVTTSQNEPQAGAEGLNKTEPTKPSSYKEICQTKSNSEYLRMGSDGKLVRLLQIQLNNWGFPVKSVDGVFGTETCAAVIRFQERHNLEPNGIVTPETSQALWAPRKDNLQMIQTQLNNWGFSVKNVNNTFSDETRSALTRFQEYRGLQPDGTIDRETSQALWAPRTDETAQTLPVENPLLDENPSARNDTQNFITEKAVETSNSAPPNAVECVIKLEIAPLETVVGKDAIEEDTLKEDAARGEVKRRVYELADVIRSKCEQDYVAIKEELKDGNDEAPKKIPVIIKNGVGVAHAVEGKIYLDSGLFSPSKFQDERAKNNQVKEINGIVAHELTHVIQAYSSEQPSWLVEGIANFIRYGRIYSDDGGVNNINCKKNGGQAQYYTTNEYSCGAAFLFFIEPI